MQLVARLEKQCFGEQRRVAGHEVAPERAHAPDAQQRGEVQVEEAGLQDFDGQVVEGEGGAAGPVRGSEHVEHFFRVARAAAATAAGDVVIVFVVFCVVVR